MTDKTTPDRKVLLDARDIVKVFGSGAGEVQAAEGRRPQALLPAS